jgi:hypothetical protein
MEATMKCTAKILLACLPLLATLCAAAQDKTPAAKPAAVLAQYDVARDGDSLLLPVTLNGKKYQFLVDTGATLNCFDRSLPLGEPRTTSRIETAAGVVARTLFNPPDASVGDLRLRSENPVFGVDLKAMREVGGDSIYGALGMDFLRKHVVQIDFDAGKLSFLQSAGPECGEPIRMPLADLERPCVWVDIAGELPKLLIIDTGHAGLSGCLDQELFESLLAKKRLKVVGNTLSETFAGKVEGRIGQVAGIALGDLQHGNLVFEESSNRKSWLGLDYLSRFVVTLDFPKSLLYLRKGKRFNEPARWDCSGLHLLRIDSSTVVHSVDKDGPAAACGLRAKDVILRLGGTAANEASMFSLRRRLCVPDGPIHVVARRGSNQIEVDMDLKQSP